MSSQSAPKLALPENKDTNHCGQAAGSGAQFSPGFNFFWLMRPKAFVLSACVLAAAGWIAVQTKPEKGPVEPLPTMTVTTVPVRFSEISRHLAVNGSIAAWDSLSLGSEINGLRIDSVAVDEGDAVKKNQVLATLNSAVLRAQLEQERAKLKANEAGLRKSIQPNRAEDLNTWRAALLQAEANVAQEEANLSRSRSNSANAQENSRRYMELRKVGAVSQMEADNSLTTARAAEAEVTGAEKRVLAMKFALRQAREKLSMAEKGGRQEDIIISRANLAESGARVKQLEAQIEQTVIRSPDDGVVVKRDAHLGEIAAAGKALFQIVRNNRLELRALVPEIDLSKISSGQSVAISSGVNSKVRFRGKVREVSPLVDQAARLGTVRIDIPANCHDVLPGQFFHGDIDLGSEKVMLVPTRAVLVRNEKSVVFKLVGNKASAQEVKVGEPVGDELEIKEGLSANDQVIFAGAGFLKDGDMVRNVFEPKNAAAR